MGNLISNRFVTGGVALFIIGTVAFLPFTNCSKNPQSASIPDTAFLSPTAKQTTLKSEFKGRVPASFCQSSESYGCMKKVYSREVASEQLVSTRDCSLVSDNLKLCPIVQTFNFNSEAAQENCNGCEESYEYTDYNCHLKIPNSEGIYPINFTENTLDQSLLKLHELCTEIAEDSK